MTGSITVEATTEVTYYFQKEGMARDQMFTVPAGKPTDMPLELVELLRKKKGSDGKAPIERDFDSGRLQPVRDPSRANGILEGLIRSAASKVEVAPLQAYAEALAQNGGDKAKADEAAKKAATGVDPESPPEPVVGPQRNGGRNGGRHS